MMKLLNKWAFLLACTLAVSCSSGGSDDPDVPDTPNKPETPSQPETPNNPTIIIQRGDHCFLIYLLLFIILEQIQI